MKSRVILFLSLLCFVACKKEQQAPQQVKPHATIEFTDFVSGESIRYADVRLTSYNSQTNNYDSAWKEKSTTTTDGFGQIRLEQDISAYCANVVSEKYFDFKYEILPFGVSKPVYWFYPEPIPAPLIEKTESDFRYQIQLFRKAKTTIHLKQINEHNGFGAPIVFGFKVTCYAENDIAEASPACIFYPFLSKLMSNNLKIDTTIIVNLGGELKNKIEVVYGDDWAVGTTKTLFLKPSSIAGNELFIEF